MVVIGYKKAACVLFKHSHRTEVKREMNMKAAQQQKAMLPRVWDER